MKKLLGYEFSLAIMGRISIFSAKANTFRWVALAKLQVNHDARTVCCRSCSA